MESKQGNEGPLLARVLRQKVLFGACQAFTIGLILFQSAWMQYLVSTPAAEGAPDFAIFYTAGRMALDGTAPQAYDSAAFYAQIRQATGMVGFTPWAYPPPLFLLCAPLALLPFGLAFLIFELGGFLALCAALRRLAGPYAGGALAFCMPAAVMCAVTGQNGFWTAALLGWFAVSLRAGGSGGVPLGLLVVKPHLALGAGLLLLLSRRWAGLALAVVVALVLLAAPTVLFGFGIWDHFAEGARKLSDLTMRGSVPVGRMTSVFALAYHQAPSARGALLVHFIVATAVAAGLVWLLRRNSAASPLALAAAVWAGLLLSPYIFDYDLVALAVAMGLVLPGLTERGGTTALAAMLVLAWIASANSEISLLRTALYGWLLPHGSPGPVIPISAAALIALGVWIAALHLRPRGDASGSSHPVAQEAAG